MATTSIRWALTKHLIDILRNDVDLASVTVEPGWPGNEYVTAEMVWVDELAGDVVVPVMSAGRKQRDDVFTIPFEIRVAGKTDLDAVMERLSVLVATIEDALANDPGLDTYDGLIDAEVVSERFTAARTPDGVLGFAEVVVEAHSRLL